MPGNPGAVGLVSRAASRRWGPARGTPVETFTAQERNALWELAAQTAADASAQIRSYASTSPAAAADAAWAAADTMHAVAAALGSRILRQAADSYDRAARAPWGRIPGPTPAGNRLRRAARLLAASTAFSSDSTLALVALVTRLAALAEAVAQLRYVQQRSVQAASARRAAERLRAARATYAAWTPKARAPVRTPGERIHLEFPVPPGPAPRGSAVPGTRTPARPGPRASRSPSSPRPRGPTR